MKRSAVPPIGRPVAVTSSAAPSGLNQPVAHPWLEQKPIGLSLHRIVVQREVFSMAKNKIPKKVIGYKVPKSVRRSPVLKALVASKIGREVLAHALTAGAAAATAVLVEERGEIADAAGKTARKGGRALGLVGAALSNGTEAAMDVVRKSASDALPKKYRKSVKNDRRGAMH